MKLSYDRRTLEVICAMQSNTNKRQYESLLSDKDVKRLKCSIDKHRNCESSPKASLKDDDIDGRSAGSMTDSGRNDSASLGVDGFRAESGVMTFPEKLMHLLECGSVNDTMWWLPDGDAFCFIPNLFAEKVLDKHFQGTKFESFTRKLNRWGFKRVAGQKVPINTVAYYHNSFHKDKPETVKDMSGGKPKNPGSREKKAVTNRPRSNSAPFVAKSRAELNPGLVGGIVLRTDTADASKSIRAEDLRPSVQDSPLLFNEEMLVKQSLAAQKSIDSTDLRNRLLLESAAGINNLRSSNELTRRLLLANSLGLGSSGISPLLGSPRQMPEHGSQSMMTRLLSPGVGDHKDIISDDIINRLIQKEITKDASNLMASRVGTMNAYNLQSDLTNRVIAQKLAIADSLGSTRDLSTQLLAHRLGSTPPNRFDPSNLGNGFFAQKNGSGDFLNNSNDALLARLLASQPLASNEFLNHSIDTARLLATSASMGMANNSERQSASDRTMTDDQALRAYILEQQRLQLQLDSLKGDKKV